MCRPASTFPLDQTTTVTFEAEDTLGNVGSATSTIHVTDTTEPDLTVPADITVGATSPTSAAVSFTVSANDVVDSNPVVECGGVSSGDTFSVGTTTVNCSATDFSGNEAFASFDVTVVATFPVLTLPSPISVLAEGPLGTPKTSGSVAAFLASASALDPQEGSLSVSNDAPGTFTIWPEGCALQRDRRAGALVCRDVERHGRRWSARGDAADVDHGVRGRAVRDTEDESGARRLSQCRAQRVRCCRRELAGRHQRRAKHVSDRHHVCYVQRDGLGGQHRVRVGHGDGRDQLQQCTGSVSARRRLLELHHRKLPRA